VKPPGRPKGAKATRARVYVRRARKDDPRVGLAYALGEPVMALQLGRPNYRRSEVLSTSPRDLVLASIACSLERIADVLEKKKGAK
jgi:hypothetical protein